jgi:hypothetical protein
MGKKAASMTLPFLSFKRRIIEHPLSAGALVIFLSIVLVASRNLVLFRFLLLLQRFRCMGRMGWTRFLLLILVWYRHESLLVKDNNRFDQIDLAAVPV